MARANDRSLGFMPLLVMTLVWLILMQFMIPIGQTTSRAGFFQINAGPPTYGCPIPRAKP
ncbi:MAG: hypothetical protein HY909_09325 [Deltaproteobacteria bacterium]|nr:hypothetical protein [Deltaproteobacteria bacterium]